MQQSTKDFLLGLSKVFIQGFMQNYSGDSVCNGIAMGIEKSKTRLFHIGFSVALIGTGVFLTLWGTATAIDKILAMQGFGYVLIGIPVILFGALIYKR